MHGRLMRGRIGAIGIPDSDHIGARFPDVVLGFAQTDHRAALGTDQIVSRDADRPPQAGGLGNDLVHRMDIFRPTDSRDGLHFSCVLIQFHAKWNSAQLEHVGQLIGEILPVHILVSWGESRGPPSGPFR